MNEKLEERTPMPAKDGIADNTEKLEEDHHGKLMRVKDLPDEYAELKDWVGEMKFGRDNVVAVQHKDSVTIKWYTQDSVISISARLPRRGPNAADNGYLGGIAEKRAPRPGETWTRGNDLADGPYTWNTWHNILADAAGWSALPLSILQNPNA